MEGEIGTGMKLFIGLVLIAIIVTIVFTLVPIIRGGSNQAITQVVNGTDALLASEFDEYDQGEPNGTKVKNSIQMYKGRPLSIVVGTLKCTNNGTQNTGYCFNAIMDGADGSEGDALRKIDLGDLQGTCFVDKTLKSTENGIEYNASTSPLTDTTSDAYVKSTGKFKSYLIKDGNDEVIGIYFKQIKLK